MEHVTSDEDQNVKEQNTKQAHGLDSVAEVDHSEFEHAFESIGDDDEDIDVTRFLHSFGDDDDYEYEIDIDIEKTEYTFT